ncbi:MAG TPA: hypothetical protein VHE60_03240, partial [Pyrinomonadaceae bacterium]|nr:hypothetical protein [Pyrinomonadaceae bacterium]
MRAVPLTSITLLALGVFAGCAARPEAIRTTSNAPTTKAPIVVQVFEAKPSEDPGDLLVPAALSVEVTAMVLAQRDGTISQL